jgi:hypothetical protein
MGPRPVTGQPPAPAGWQVPPGGEPAAPGRVGTEQVGTEWAGAERVGAGPTGHPLVDAALDELDRASELPMEAQVAAYEAAHRVLQQTLATIDQG